MSVATNGAEPRASIQPNRFPGACIVCGVHVRSRGGAVRKIAGEWRLYCATHHFAGEPPPANDGPPASAPAGGDAPPCSERAALAAVALYRHAVNDKRAPEGGEAVDVARMLAALAVWRSGSSEAARALADATPAADPRLANASDDLVGEILDRPRLMSRDPLMQAISRAQHGPELPPAPLGDTDVAALAARFPGASESSITNAIRWLRAEGFGDAEMLRPTGLGARRRTDCPPVAPLVIKVATGALSIQGAKQARAIGPAVSDADATATADALAGPPADSPTARAFAASGVGPNDDVRGSIRGGVVTVIPDGTPGPARLAARFPIHPAPAKPAPKRERASKGGRWANLRKGGKG